MWQAMVRQLGNEYIHLSVFPELNNEIVKEYYEFMTEFHNSWIPDMEQSMVSDDDDDEPEEEGTAW